MSSGNGLKCDGNDLLRELAAGNGLQLLEGTLQQYTVTHGDQTPSQLANQQLLHSLAQAIIHRLLSHEVTLLDPPSNLQWRSFSHDKTNEGKRYGWIGQTNISPAMRRMLLDVFRPGEAGTFYKAIRLLRDRCLVTCRQELLPVKAQIFIRRDKEISWNETYEQIESVNQRVWDYRNKIVEAPDHSNVQIEAVYFLTICICRYPKIWGDATRDGEPFAPEHREIKGQMGRGRMHLDPTTLLAHGAAQKWQARSAFLCLFNQLVEEAIPYYPDMRARAQTLPRRVAETENTLRIIAEVLLDTEYQIRRHKQSSSSSSSTALVAIRPLGGIQGVQAYGGEKLEARGEGRVLEESDPFAVRVVQVQQKGLTLGSLQCIYLLIMRIVQDPLILDLYHSAAMSPAEDRPPGIGMRGSSPPPGSALFGGKVYTRDSPCVIIQQPLYDLLRASFWELSTHQRLPGEGDLDPAKYDLLVECWLLWLVPWKASTRSKTQEYTDQWRLYVASNLHFYTTLHAMFFRAQETMQNNTMSDASLLQIAILEKVTAAFDAPLLEATASLTKEFRDRYPTSSHRRGGGGGGHGRDQQAAYLASPSVQTVQNNEWTIMHEAMKNQHHALYPASVGRDSVSIDDYHHCGIVSMADGASSWTAISRDLTAELRRLESTQRRQQNAWQAVLPQRLGFSAKLGYMWFWLLASGACAACVMLSFLCQQYLLMLLSLVSLLVSLNAHSASPSEEDAASRLEAVLGKLDSLRNAVGGAAFDATSQNLLPRGHERNVASAQKVEQSRSAVSFDRHLYIKSRRFDALEPDHARRHIYRSESPFFVDLIVQWCNAANNKFDFPRGYLRPGVEATAESGSKKPWDDYPHTWGQVCTRFFRTNPRLTWQNRVMELHDAPRINVRWLAQVRVLCVLAGFLLWQSRHLVIHFLGAAFRCLPSVWLLLVVGILSALTLASTAKDPHMALLFVALILAALAVYHYEPIVASIIHAEPKAGGVSDYMSEMVWELMFVLPAVYFYSNDHAAIDW